MTILEAASLCPFLLADGGIETRIAFETDIPLDPEMGVARLIEDDRPWRGSTASISTWDAAMESRCRSAHRPSGRAPSGCAGPG
jgi:hypothetical protein